MKIQKKNWGGGRVRGGGGGGGGLGWRMGGQGRCERRSEVFVKMGGGGWVGKGGGGQVRGVRVDVNIEVKFL